MKKVVFLDRDGVLNKEIGDYITKTEDFEINPGVINALKTFQNKGYEFIVITNQGGIIKGLYTHETLGEIHNKLLSYLSKEQISVLDIYYCPHHPDYTKCLCRKPLPLMLEKAIAKFKINISQSYFIGDTDRDMQAAESVGVKPIKVNANQDLNTITNFIS